MSIESARWGGFGGEGHKTSAPQFQFTAPGNISAGDAKAASKKNFVHIERFQSEFWPENSKLFLDAS